MRRCAVWNTDRRVHAAAVSRFCKPWPSVRRTADGTGDSRLAGLSLAWYVLAILLAVHTFNWLDRYLLVILLEAIKHDLNLSDTALGLPLPACRSLAGQIGPRAAR